MIHDSFGGYIGKGSNEVKSSFSSLYIITYYIELLKKRTKLTDEEIKIFIERDIFVDANYCLKKNIIDRILKFPKINNPEYYSNVSNLQLNLDSFLKKTNLNHIYIDDDLINSNNDIIINGNNFNRDMNEVKSVNDLSIFLDNNFIIKKDNSKPIIIHFNSNLASSIYANSNPLILTQFNYRLAMIQKRIPIIAFIEGPQFFDILSSIIMCPIRIMMKPSIIQSSFTFKNSGSLNYGQKTIDVIDNSIFTFNNVIKFYKETTILPNNFYKEIRNRIINLTPKELLKYNIIHLCLNINKKNITNKDIIKYLQLNNLFGFNELKIKKNNFNKNNKNNERIP
jgi:ATP-dependent protease ClpP protease subunit